MVKMTKKANLSKCSFGIGWIVESLHYFLDRQILPALIIFGSTNDPVCAMPKRFHKLISFVDIKPVPADHKRAFPHYNRGSAPKITLLSFLSILVLPEFFPFLSTLFFRLLHQRMQKYTIDHQSALP
mmetsp:Transcript_21929/g.36330  ORF Transcript_21929/g.36330 Transcript_21929/m.36330 type:complete len:127 (-) Transcript_21929:14-394(-)